jgi:hypothetical protein
MKEFSLTYIPRTRVEYISCVTWRNFKDPVQGNGLLPSFVAKPSMKASDDLLKVRLVIRGNITSSYHEIYQRYKT